MAVSDYLQKSSGTCRYRYSKLKNVLYLVSAEHLKDVQIDNGEAYISGLTELPLKINGFNIQFNEETSLDERYKFQKTLTISVHGYAKQSLFRNRCYAIIEDVEGTFYMVNVDFPSRITHTFNLSKDTNQTDFTFSSLSNFPTLKLNAEFESDDAICLGLNVHGIDKLQLIEFEKAKLDAVNKIVYSTDFFKDIEFLGDSCSFQEVYDGFKVTSTITFDIALDDYKPSWQYNLLEFLDNRYSAIITPKGDDNEYYPGYNFGLQPSYTIQTASNKGESDIITITLTEASVYGSTAAVDWNSQQATGTIWRWVKLVGDTICYECIGLNRARYLVRQEVNSFGIPTGNYQVMEGYESQYQNLHIVDTFTTEEVFDTMECKGDVCEIETDIPSTIYFNALTCYTYSVKTSCDWQINNIPSNITVSPSSGEAGETYSVSICNTSSDYIENNMTLKCCTKTKVINLSVLPVSSCIRPLTQNINCLAQDVVFVYDGNCRIEVTSISSALTYSIGNNTLTISVPRNYGSSAITWSIATTNCNCSSASTTLTINQDKTYEQWVVEDGFECESGNSYHVERMYTGTTQDNINSITSETRKGTLIQSGDTRCGSSQTKWEWDNESYYCVDGDKFKTEFEYISFDNGSTWRKTGNTRLGDMVEADSEWCNSAVTYSWVITSNYDCSGTTSYYLYQKYEQRGEQDPIPVYPNYWSINGDGTQSLSKKMDNDPYCGYNPSGTTYRWVNIPITDDYYCDECPFLGKWLATYYGGTTSSAECDVSSAITHFEITLTDLTEVEIGDCVTSIGSSAFTGCKILTSCTIGSGVTSIGDRAFRQCSNLTSIDIPDSVEIIGDSVFENCYSLTTCTIGSGVTSIPDGAFYECRSLSSCTIGSGVTSIGDYAFYGCRSLTSITVESTTPPTLGSYVLSITNNCPIYVPAASVNAYKAASGWSTYASRIQAIP